MVQGSADITTYCGSARRATALADRQDQRAAPEPVVPVVPPVPVVPDGPTEFEPVLPEVPPDGAPDMPAPLPDVESVVLPAVPPAAPPAVPPIVPLLPDVSPDVAPPVMPEPAVDPPDMPLVPEPVVPVDGEAVVLGVVVVDAPGDVVSAVRRSHAASAAPSAAVASTSLVNLDMDCIEISLGTRMRFFQRSHPSSDECSCRDYPATSNDTAEVPSFEVLDPQPNALFVPTCATALSPSETPFILNRKQTGEKPGVKVTCKMSKLYTHSERLCVLGQATQAGSGKLASASRRSAGSPLASRFESDSIWRKRRAPGSPMVSPSIWRVMLLSFRPCALWLASSART